MERTDDSEDDELDREFEKVAATFCSPAPSLSPSSQIEIKNETECSLGDSNSRLTFQFPGWGIDIEKGAAITRHHENNSNHNNGVIVGHSELSSSKKSFGAADTPGNGTFVYGLPNEIWTNIFRRLNVREICSLRQTSSWMYELCFHDDAWHHIHCEDEQEDNERLPLPRWLNIKTSIMRSQIKQRLSYFSKGYDYLRSALNSWWNVGGPDLHYSSKSLNSLIRKMTACDWPIVYEAFAVIFLERTDILAGNLLKEFGTGGMHNSDACFSNKGKSDQFYQFCMEEWSTSKGKYLSTTRAKSHISSDGLYLKSIESHEGLAGKEMWQYVQKLWERYKHWLSLVSTHCQDLNYEVMVERARSMTWSSTPTVYDKGIICFRNQILIRYNIRNALQCGLSWLIGQDALGFASERDVHLLNAVLHLLQEVDVADDFTLSPKTYTRAKLKRCFLLNGVTSKVLS